MPSTVLFDPPRRLRIPEQLLPLWRIPTSDTKRDAKSNQPLRSPAKSLAFGGLFMEAHTQPYQAKGMAATKEVPPIPHFSGPNLSGACADLLRTSPRACSLRQWPWLASKGFRSALEREPASLVRFCCSPPCAIQFVSIPDRTRRAEAISPHLRPQSRAPDPKLRDTDKERNNGLETRTRPETRGSRRANESSVQAPSPSIRRSWALSTSAGVTSHKDWSHGVDFAFSPEGQL